MIRVYVAHPYKGHELNLKRIETLIKDLIKKYPNHVFISPVHAFEFMYDNSDYLKGMDCCFELLNMCDEVWISTTDYQANSWKESTGCCMEYGYAKARGKTIKFI